MYACFYCKRQLYVAILNKFIIIILLLLLFIILLLLLLLLYIIIKRKYTKTYRAFVIDRKVCVRRLYIVVLLL